MASQSINSDTSEIKALNRIVWRTAISSRLERFSALLNAPEAQNHFGETFIAKLSTKIDRLLRIILIVSAIYAVLMLSLFAAQDPKKTEFQILGYSFKNLGYYKEFLLFAAAALSPVSSAISAYRRYLSELRAIALTKLFPNPDIREFATHIYRDAYTDPLLKDRFAPHIRPHGFTSFLVAAFGIVLLVLLLAFLGASFILQIVVIYDVAANPSSSIYINLFIVSFSLSAILLSWLIGILQLPLPEVDLAAHTKLSQLRENDKAKYKETISRLATESAKRERAWTIGSSIGIFVLAYSASAVLFFPETHQSLGLLLAKAIPGAAMVVLVATSIASRIKRAMYRSYFKKYPEGTDSYLNAFSRVTKAVSTARLSLTIIISLGYSLAALKIA